MEKGILIADSGSTKTDWAYLLNNEVSYFNTLGLNPNYVSDLYILDQIKALPLEVGTIYFYSAGCDGEKQQNEIIKLFEEHWGDVDVHVGSDLWGAVRACLGNEEGAVGIIGTGSNLTFHVNGVLDGIAAPGYILADEGGGTFLGRAILNKFFRGRLSDQVNQWIEKNVGTKSAIINKLYIQPSGIPYYLAQVAKCMQFYKEDPELEKILNKSINAFYEEQVLLLQEKHPFKDIALVGSVAFHFQEEYKSFLATKKINLVKVIQKPIDGLVDYYKHKNK